MVGKDPAADDRKPTTVVANDPNSWKGGLKHIGGSQSDHWNNRIANDTALALWVANADQENRDVKYEAAIAGLVGIAPKDELEGMMAAQLIAAHSAAMECYRRAMLGEQTFEGRRENLSQANKLSRTYATLLEALNRHRGKGAQKVTVEHVHVHAGGQAVVGTVETPRIGNRPQSEGQPDAKQISHAPQPAVRGADKDRESTTIRRSTRCKANFPCTSAGGAGRGQGTGILASRRRCRTAAAGCTADHHQGLRKVTKTPSSTGAIRPGRLPGAAKLQGWFAP